ncbi:MAG: 4Fe-4S dicluster domain-containing protein [Spirochaetota bacterium]
MKAHIILFSPTGNTRKAAEYITRALEDSGIACTATDITGSRTLFGSPDGFSHIARMVPPHDILLVGGPVYAHHLQYHLAGLITGLPRPDGERWGRLALPFVTYGGISTGIALAEAGRLLRKRGRTVIGGARFSMSHRMTRAFLDTEYNAHTNDTAVRKTAAALAESVRDALHSPKVTDRTHLLSFQPLSVRLKAHLLFRERLWHRKRYPKVTIDRERCSGCGICIRACPVLHLEENISGVHRSLQNECIHCFGCVAACPQRAVGLAGDLDRGRSFMAAMIEKHGGREQPASCTL